MTEYIKRENALSVAYKIGKKEYDMGRFSNTATVMVVEDELRAIPAADVVERKKGKWIEYPEVLKLTDALNDEYIGCSVCETVWNMMDNDVERFNFCPNCGADMREKS